MKYKFKIKGLDCANCAAELERAIQKIDEVKEASISFMTEKLVIECDEENKEEVMKKVHNGIIDIEYLMEASGNTDNEDVINALKTMEPNGVTIADFLIDEYINIESCLAKIKVPTMIIGGEDERLAIPEYSEKLHESIKKSEMVMIPGRHMSCLARKNSVKEIVCEFIDEKILKN